MISSWYIGDKDRIHKPNLIVNSGKNVDIPFGHENFSLICRGEMYHHVYWEKDQTSILTSEDCASIALAAGSVCSSSNFKKGIEIRELHFGPINNMSEGVYKCVEDDAAGYTQSYVDWVTVTVTGKVVTSIQI